DRWGFRFEAAPAPGFDLCRPLPRPDGATEAVDIRTLPFVRFDDNEAHDHLAGINLGGAPGDFFDPGVAGVTPGRGEPLVLRNTRIWNANWAFTSHTHHAVDNLDIADSAYGLAAPAHQVRTRHSKDSDWGRITFQRTEVPIRLPEVRLPGKGTLSEPFDLLDYVGDHLPPMTA